MLGVKEKKDLTETVKGTVKGLFELELYGDGHYYSSIIAKPIRAKVSHQVACFM